MAVRVPTEAEIRRNIRKFKPTPAERKLIIRGLSQNGVPEREFSGMRRIMKYKYDFLI